jgi:hypothetical protein
VGRLYVAYPYQGAMREPECWDRHGEELTPTSFFVSIILLKVLASRGVWAYTFVVSILKHYIIFKFLFLTFKTF